MSRWAPGSAPTRRTSLASPSAATGTAGSSRTRSTSSRSTTASAPGIVSTPGCEIKISDGGWITRTEYGHGHLRRQCEGLPRPARRSATQIYHDHGPVAAVRLQGADRGRRRLQRRPDERGALRQRHRRGLRRRARVPDQAGGQWRGRPRHRRQVRDRDPGRRPMRPATKRWAAATSRSDNTHPPRAAHHGPPLASCPRGS